MSMFLSPADPRLAQKKSARPAALAILAEFAHHSSVVCCPPLPFAGIRDFQRTASCAWPRFVACSADTSSDNLISRLCESTFLTSVAALGTVAALYKILGVISA